MGFLIKAALLFVVLYVVYRVAHTLITKPNLRYYLWKTLKDAKYMYYRYHV